jgi:hypothetical protein
LGRISVFSSSENDSGEDNGIICAIVVIARLRTTGRECDNNGVKSGSGRKVEVEKYVGNLVKRIERMDSDSTSPCGVVAGYRVQIRGRK